MQIRRLAIGAVIAGAVVIGATACGSDDSSTTASSSVAATTSASSTGSGTTAQAPADLDAAAAQQILRTVVDPASSPEQVAGLVDSTDPAIGQKLNGFAQGASAGGYTPSVFTVTSVAADGTDKATATVSVASPHTPAPVAIPYGYTKSGGAWKLSSSAVTALLSMASGPR
ncbi:DUF4878 domain-containing protein [Williamsia herbipolensis]|uniref:DUF4878 domain-containing protein n=1 Tax=Williamsia herbipolensis TaxID=1603258 RepID=A0AAU4K6I7_9NOCA|nr:DUF4878 domain-containing protein [Williamsia herbipolensis]